MRLARKLLQHIDVATNHRRLRDDAHRLLKLHTHFEALSRELVIGFEWNVRIRREREDDLVAFPRRLQQLLTQQLRRFHFRNDLAIEVSACAVTKILVRGPAEAISATVNADRKSTRL